MDFPRIRDQSGEFLCGFSKKCFHFFKKGLESNANSVDICSMYLIIYGVQAICRLEW